MRKSRQLIKKLVAKLFKKDGKPYEMSDGQVEIFANLIDPEEKYIWMSAPTRWGKTETLALAVLYLAVFHKLKIPIVAGSYDKAEKIMEYVAEHIADHPVFYEGLFLKDSKDIERLKIRMSKGALRWATGGWVFVTSIDSRSIVKEGEGAVGEGGDVVILEEAGLIRQKEQFSKVVRMPESGRGWGKLVMSGNCIEGSVFEEAYKGDLYTKVRITLEQSVEEGRYTWGELEAKKQQTTSKDWKRYYLVEFPSPFEFAYFKPRKYGLLPDEMLYVGAVDLALGESKKGSLTGINIIGVDENGQAYQIESFGEILTPDKTIEYILSLPYEFDRFGVEDVLFQRYFLRVIEEKSKQMGKYIPFIGVPQTKKKEERIESLEPFINTGQIKFKGDDILWEHMMGYPEIEHLDVLDSFEICWRLARNIGRELGTIRRSTPPLPAPRNIGIINLNKFHG